MEASAKVVYVVVLDDDDDDDDGGGGVDGGRKKPTSFRYTRSVLQSTLQLMGCKPRHAFKISQRVFQMVREQEEAEGSFEASNGCRTNSCSDKASDKDEDDRSQPFDLYKRRTTVIIGRKVFLDLTCDALSEYKYVGPNQRADLILACRIRERKESVIILLCGTSGCGKSTLSALLGSRLGITTIVSTDSIRHMMRSFVDEKQNPLLWASTYHAGDYLDPVAVAEAKAKRKAKKSAGIISSTSITNQEQETAKPEGRTSTAATSHLISKKQMAVEGFKAQSEMIIDSLDTLMTSWESRKESVVVEGVHLSLNFVMGLMKKHPSIIPFMIYFSNEEKHLERFAVRAKYMTLDPSKNKYVKYIKNIRAIQDYHSDRADKHLVPKINNTNVDKSVALIHATVFSCLRRRSIGDQLYDPATNTVAVVDEEHRNQRDANCCSSSKGMLQLIQRQGSDRRLMALLNNDGSVAKAWPIEDSALAAKDEFVGAPVVYGPLLQIGKAEPVNLQFGNFGMSAWIMDAGATSRASSVDESRGDLTDNGSRCLSSCCSSPRAASSSKELKEELSVHGSDEEDDPDDPPELDSDEDFNDSHHKHAQGEAR
ncbi:hypothetical protein M569_03793 [Genlisea aurea]|uniref:Uncharacterized protein n=1 Tax=Genlisea aurea TaxID=192259 RepID=S8CVW3_9LAMI|nr:hypothetical protein M569_03793 [Genlisea aurea]